jgi:polyisoprenoid-binding protein YceI
MKTLLTSIPTLISFFVTLAGAMAQTQSFTIDATASQVSWTGYAEVGTWAPTGSIQVAKGQVTQSGNQITNAILTMDMATIQHENKQMQDHLRSGTFFDVTRFPDATFVLRSLTGTTATGQLTIKGITKPISFPVLVSQVSNGLQIKGKAVVDRTQFGVRYNSTSFFTDLGDQAIKNDFSVTFDLLAKPVGSSKRNASR